MFDKIEELLTTGRTTLEDYQPSTNIQTLRLLIDQMELQEIKSQKMQADIYDHDERITDLEAKITSIDENYFSVSGYCVLLAKKCPQDQARHWGLAATALSQVKDIQIGKVYDAKFGEINSYHRAVLAEIIGKN